MNAARAFMRREDYQPKQPRNEKICALFDISCVKCNSVNLKIVGEFNEDSGELAVFLYCPRCKVREQLPVR